MGKLHLKSFALACGVLWGAGVLLLGWIAPSGYGGSFVSAIGKFYIGYAPGFAGGIVGGIWGFIDAFVGGAIFVWLYNLFVSKKQG